MTTSQKPSLVHICGAFIANVTLKEAVDFVERLVEIGKPCYVVTPNVDHIMKLRSDANFSAAYAEAALVLADGMPLIWASYFLGTPLKEKVSGSDLLPLVCQRAAKRDYRVFFLGGRPGAAQKAKEILERRHPGIQIVGAYSPPYGFETDAAENERIIRIIQDARPHILFVGLGAPKQEKWIRLHHRRYGAGVSIGVGISFEMLSGTIRRAPVWMQRVGLEWAWRLAMEPRRLWKRYLWDDPKFFSLVLQQKFSRTSA